MPKPKLLETFPNPFPGRDYEIVMTCPEFTALCPVGGIESDAQELEALEGGAPDFGTITVTYVPGRSCVSGVSGTTAFSTNGPSTRSLMT